MVFKFISLFSLLLLGVAFATERISNYEGYKIYDVNPKNAFEKDLLLRLSADEDYDFFTLPRLLGEPARLMVKPENQVDFEIFLKNYNLPYDVINYNVGETLTSYAAEARFASFEPTNLTFNKYYRHSEINAYLENLAKSYSQRISVRSIGKSYEGRDMKVLNITNGDGKSANKKVIFVDAGIHAREWIAPSVALYIIQQLVQNFEENSHLLKDYDWIILPVVNPDGYEYTHTNTRMWRKTRKPVTKSCTGTDANRNFDFHWGEKGASSIPCAEDFKGPNAFSEIEAQHVRDLMHSLAGRGKFYLTLHSFGKYLLYPWGWTEALPSTWKDLDEVAQAGATAIRQSTKSNYTVGSSTNVLYAAAGGSDDYAFAECKFPISITMELPAGGSGFDPSVTQIKPFNQESWTGIKAMAERVIAKY